MQMLIIDCHGNETIFMKNMENKINHYLGFHSKCEDPASKSCKNLKPFDNKDAQTDFVVKYICMTLTFYSLNGINLQRCFISTNVQKQQILLKVYTQ
jgi:hypothetical protein